MAENAAIIDHYALDSAAASASASARYVGCFAHPSQNLARFVGRDHSPGIDRSMSWADCAAVASSIGAFRAQNPKLYNGRLVFVQECPMCNGDAGTASCGYPWVSAGAGPFAGAGGFRTADISQWVRRPDTECCAARDADGHCMGGPYRMAAYEWYESAPPRRTPSSGTAVETVKREKQCESFYQWSNRHKHHTNTDTEVEKGVRASYDKAPEQSKEELARLDLQRKRDKERYEAFQEAYKKISQLPSKVENALCCAFDNCGAKGAAVTPPKKGPRPSGSEQRYWRGSTTLFEPEDPLPSMPSSSSPWQGP